MKRWRIDLALGLIALAFGLPSLAYPFGRDQGLFYYAAREWLERGQVLYRDVWDHKPPVIYLIHMIGIAIFGDHVWAIRVLELFVAIPAFGFLGARLATPRGTPVAPGTIGATWLVASVSYFGFFGYWDTAQSEIWCTLFALASITSVLRIDRPLHAYAWGGFFAAVALFTKPPGLPFVLVAVAAVLIRSFREGGRSGLVRAIGLFAAGGAAFSVPLLGYFAAKHALPAMVDIVIGANGTYVANERGADGLDDVFTRSVEAFGLFEPFSSVALAAVFLAGLHGAIRRDRGAVLRYVMPLALLLATFASVVMQLKFYGYHWVPIVAGMTVMGATLWIELVDFSRERNRSTAPIFAVAVALLFTVSFDASKRWFLDARNAIRYETGAMDKLALAHTYDRPGWYDAGAAEEVGAWLRDHARPEDTLLVRGFEPEIYAISGLHYTGRFYWTTFLTAPGRVYRRSELLAEDRAELERHAPRWVVAISIDSEIDSPAFFEKMGYSRVFASQAFVVMTKP